MSRALQFVRRWFAMLTDPAPSFNPFTCPVSLAQELSGSSFRIFPPHAKFSSRTVALGSTIGRPFDPWVGPGRARPVSISRPSAWGDTSGSRSRERLLAVRTDRVPVCPPLNVTRAILVQLRVACVFRRSRPPIPSECGHPSERSDARSPMLLSCGRLPVSSPAVCASILHSR